MAKLNPKKSIGMTREQLEQKYPEADIDFLIMIAEGRLEITDFLERRSDEFDEMFDSKTGYSTKIKKLFDEYLSDNDRDYFLPQDAVALKQIKKKVQKIIGDTVGMMTEVYANDMAEIYNYIRLYTLWILDVKLDGEVDYFEKPVAPEMESGESIVGESSKDDSDKKSPINDPGFTKQKLGELVNAKPLGKSITQRTTSIVTSLDKSLDKLIKSATVPDKDGKGMNVNTFLKHLDNKLTKDFKNRLKYAHKLGIEEAESIGEGDVFQSNKFLLRKYQRVEVLDRKTCLVCAKIDGSTYTEPLGKIHPHCRGIDAPCKLDEEGNVKYREGIRGKRRRGDSFNKWFNNLSEKDKKRTLGVSKYEKYKSGKLDVKDLVKANRVQTLKEVRQKEALNKVADKFKNDYTTAKRLVNHYNAKLPVKNINLVKKQSDITAYHKFLNQKETIYNLLSNEELKKAGVTRQSLLNEIKLERRLLSTKEKQLKLKKAVKSAKR